MGNDFAFDADDFRLQDVLFTSHLKFRIPRYQRPYTWDEDQISDLWNDLRDDHSNYFGSLIFNTEFHDRTGYYDIIDGQQRLLTITILCAALRDLAREFDHKRSDIFHRRDIAIEDDEGKETYRIKCSDSLQKFFELYIQNSEGGILESNPKEKEEKLVKSNYKYFHEKITASINTIQDDSKKLEHLQSLRNKIRALPVIKIEIDNEDDAYDIFETTNARGVDLSIADLLKNMIFNKLRNTEDKDIAKIYWDEIVKNIQGTGAELKKFIRYYWISKYSFVSEKKLYKTIKSKITDYEKLLMDLHSNSIWFNKLCDSNRDSWEDENFKSVEHIHSSLRALKIMSVSQCYVLFLSILRNYKKFGTDPKRVFKWVESFTFKYSAVCKMPGNRLEKLYSSYARKIEEESQKEDKSVVSKKMQSLFEELKKELKGAEPKFEQFKEAFEDSVYSKSEQNRIMVKYILSGINKIYDDSEFDYASVNIEHFLPQKPGNDWGLSQKDIKDYVNKLGNLTIVSKKINSSIGNKNPKEKVKELSKSTIGLTKVLVDQVIKNEYKWGEGDIKSRQVELADVAYHKIWVIN
jgi:hypothetical protein